MVDESMRVHVGRLACLLRRGQEFTRLPLLSLR
jgi:hypothetical protein